jgi:hypothetical protein
MAADVPNLYSECIRSGVKTVLFNPDILHTLPTKFARDLAEAALKVVVKVHTDLSTRNSYVSEHHRHRENYWSSSKWERLFSGRLYPQVPKHLVRFHRVGRRDRESARALVRTLTMLSREVAVAGSRLQSVRSELMALVRVSPSK